MSDMCTNCGHYLRDDEYRVCSDCRRIEEEEQAKDRDARLAEAREDLLWACKHYDHWYMNGISGDAGTIAYDLVSHIRKALTRLRDPEAK